MKCPFFLFSLSLSLAQSRSFSTLFTHTHTNRNSPFCLHILHLTRTLSNIIIGNLISQSIQWQRQQQQQLSHLYLISRLFSFTILTFSTFYRLIINFKQHYMPVMQLLFPHDRLFTCDFFENQIELQPFLDIHKYIEMIDMIK